MCAADYGRRAPSEGDAAPLWGGSACISMVAAREKRANASSNGQRLPLLRFPRLQNSHAFIFRAGQEQPCCFSVLMTSPVILHLDMERARPACCLDRARLVRLTGVNNELWARKTPQ